MLNTTISNARELQVRKMQTQLSRLLASIVASYIPKKTVDNIVAKHVRFLTEIEGICAKVKFISAWKGIAQERHSYYHSCPKLGEVPRSSRKRAVG